MSLDSFNFQSDLFPSLFFAIIWFHGWGNMGEKSGVEMQYQVAQHLLEAAIEVFPLSSRREVFWEWSCVV